MLQDATGEHESAESRLVTREEENAPLLVLDLGLDIVDGVRGLNLEGDGLTREATNERKISDPFQRKTRNANQLTF